jgi:hypothetical protein
MKVMKIQETSLDACVREAQKENVVILQNGIPVVFIRTVKGLDLEQVFLGQSDEFWKMIESRRKSKSVSWEEMEKQLGINQKKPSKNNHHRNGKQIRGKAKK